MIRTNLATEGALTHDILGHRVASRYVLEDEAVSYGVVVVRGDEDTSAKPADKGDKPIGISIKKMLPEPTCKTACENKEQLKAPYGRGQKEYWDVNGCISIVEEGSVIVRVFEDVKIGDPVKYTKDGDADINAEPYKTKMVGMCGASGEDLPNATYETSAKAFELAIVRINK